jgi:hypothetical protein
MCMETSIECIKYVAVLGPRAAVAAVEPPKASKGLPKQFPSAKRVGLEDGSKGTYKHGVRRDGGLPSLGLSWSPHSLAWVLPYVWMGRPQAC